jgi:anti-sigma factor (TIGR02949 family)
MSWTDDLRRLLRRVLSRPSDGMEGGISCREAAEQLYDWLDGELEPEAASRVGTHLETCARCYPFLVFETSFRQAVTRAAQSTETPEDLRDRVLEALETEGMPPP